MYKCGEERGVCVVGAMALACYISMMQCNEIAVACILHPGPHATDTDPATGLPCPPLGPQPSTLQKTIHRRRGPG